jgi:hypothetical protein
VGLGEPKALPLLTAGHVAALLVPELDAGPLGEPFDRLGEGQVLDLADERDDVPALAAAEAVVVAPGRGDVERGRLLLMEGAQPLEVAPARVAQLNVFADDIGDQRTLPYERDVLVADPPSPPCHARESRACRRYVELLHRRHPRLPSR